jgi:hypothetical protein
MAGISGMDQNPYESPREAAEKPRSRRVANPMYPATPNYRLHAVILLAMLLALVGLLLYPAVFYSMR